MRTAVVPACLLLAFLAVAGPAIAADPTYAERLGWAPGTKVVIFHADDAGMSHGSNIGIVRALEQGVVTSTSIMMPCGWVPEMAKYVKEHPKVDAGVHLTLTSEWDLYRWGPVAGKPAVPGLADQDGYLWDNVRLVDEHASPDEIEREIRAQIEKIEGMGIKPTHIDSHMGTLFSRPDYVERYVKVGIEKQIPVLAIAGHMTYAKKEQDAETTSSVKTLAEQVWNGGLPVIDDIHTASYDWKEGPKTQRFIEMLRTLQPGITEVIVHCSGPTDEFPLITPSAALRYADTEAMVDPELRKAIEQEGIVLSTWRELKERRDKVGPAKP